jgi:hypothetical protein
MGKRNGTAGDLKGASHNLKTYRVTIVRESGLEPLSGEYLQRLEETFDVQASTKEEVFRKSQFITSLKFRGQLRRTFIDGKEYFSEAY